ncbi:unnamed protein product [Durusdinium trenchii]|uniref:Uncharacterized protein n=1 Tax=Durusdinium trenchii TaxID=1381693 RepID=A0ABP0L6S4_9DINO
MWRAISAATWRTSRAVRARFCGLPWAPYTAWLQSSLLKNSLRSLRLLQVLKGPISCKACLSEVTSHVGDLYWHSILYIVRTDLSPPNLRSKSEKCLYKLTSLMPSYHVPQLALGDSQVHAIEVAVSSLWSRRA